MGKAFQTLTDNIYRIFLTSPADNTDQKEMTKRHWQR